jgi:nickel/cobalt exporter
LNDTVLTSIALTGFTVAFFHAAIPTHWLPFVAAGRAQHWSNRKTLTVTAFAGTGHVLATALVGFLLTVCGIVLNARVGIWFPFAAGGLLIFLGSFYLRRQLSGRAHSHTHLFSKGEHEHISDDQKHELKHAIEHVRGPEIASSPTSDRVAITSLFALLTFSPCEAFLPIYVSGIRFGWSGFGLLTIILSLATVAGMLFFTSVTLAGIRSMRLPWFERFENGIMGCLLVLVGVIVIFLER